MSEQDFHYFATALIGSLTAFSLLKVYKTQQLISEKKKLIEKISSTTIKSPDDELSNGQTVILKGSVSRNTKDNRNDKIMRKNDSGKVQEYILYIKYKEAMYSNQNFTSKDQYVINLKDMLGRADVSFNPSFLLGGPKRSVTINNYDQADYSRILEITRWDNKKRRLTFGEKLESLMLSYFRAIGTLVVADTGRPGYLRGIDVGTREVETGLKVGASIMALGTIGINVNGDISIQPNLLFKDRLSILTNLQDIVQGEESSRNLWLFILFLGGLYVGRRAYKYNKKNGIVERVKNWWNRQRSQKAVVN